MDDDLEGIRQRLQIVTDAYLIQVGLDFLFELSWDLMCITNPDGYFIKLNSAWTQLGWSLDELMSKPYLEFVHPEDKGKTDQQATIMYEGKRVEFEFSNRYVGKDGKVFHLVWRTAQLPGNPGYLSAVARITHVEDTWQSGRMH